MRRRDHKAGPAGRDRAGRPSALLAAQVARGGERVCRLAGLRDEERKPARRAVAKLRAEVDLDRHMGNRTLFVDALRRLEYRGYDTAGGRDAGLRQDRTASRRGQAQQPRPLPGRQAGSGTDLYRSQALGDARRPERDQTHIPSRPTTSRSSIVASSRTSKHCAASRSNSASASRRRPTPRRSSSW